jgi:hypothetical protein
MFPGRQMPDMFFDAHPNLAPFEIPRLLATLGIFACHGYGCTFATIMKRSGMDFDGLLGTDVHGPPMSHYCCNRLWHAVSRKAIA